MLVSTFDIQRQHKQLWN